jgi:TATA-box binding protein (TBP) (component of TFIID and TFIIIB)
MRITNIVSMFTPSDYGKKLSLEDISLGDYDRRRCHARKLSIDSVRVMLWPARVQIMGAASEVQARRVADSVVALLLEAGLEDISVNDYRVLTISGTFTVFNRLDMSKMAKDFDVFYEPEVQNSATVTMGGYKALVYPSGTVMCVGFHSESECLSSMLDLYILLLSCIAK